MENTITFRSLLATVTWIDYSADAVGIEFDRQLEIMPTVAGLADLIVDVRAVADEMLRQPEPSSGHRRCIIFDGLPEQTLKDALAGVCTACAPKLPILKCRPDTLARRSRRKFRRFLRNAKPGRRREGSAPASTHTETQSDRHAQASSIFEIRQDAGVVLNRMALATRALAEIVKRCCFVSSGPFRRNEKFVRSLN